MMVSCKCFADGGCTEQDLEQIETGLTPVEQKDLEEDLRRVPGPEPTYDTLKVKKNQVTKL